MEDNSLVLAIDNHNVANGDGSWFDNKLDTTGAFIDDVSEAVTKGSVGAVVAGVDSILNTGISIANFLGAEIDPINTYDVLREYDDDLGKYYKEHKAGVETAGFILTSMIPGIAGVKAVQAAKAGIMGTNILKSSGLMRALTADYATAAKIEFASGTSPFSILNANVIKGLVQGFGSSAIDMAAFETAVTATMYQSPILKEQSAKDLFWNIATGTIVGGAIGGTLSGVGFAYGIKKAGNIIDKELFPYKNIEMLPETSTSDLKLINLYRQKFSMPDAAINSEITSELDDVSRLKLIEDTRTKTLERIDVLARQEFNKLAGGDERIGQQLYNKFQSAQSLEDVTAGLINTREISRITPSETVKFGDIFYPRHGIERPEFEKIIAEDFKSQLFDLEATKNTQGYKVVGPIEDLKVTSSRSIHANKDAAFAAGYDLYLNSNRQFSVNPASKILEATDLRRLQNNLIIDFERNGTLVDKATPGLADLATKSNPISVKGDVVLAGNLDPIKIADTLKYDPTQGSQLDAQARYIWAQEQKNIRWPNKVIGENDLAMLERAYQDGDAAKGFLIRTLDGNTSVGPVNEQLKGYIDFKKRQFAQLLNGKPIDEIGLRLNVGDKWLTGETDDLIKIGQGYDYNQPRYGRVTYDEGIYAKATFKSMQLDGLTEYHRQVDLVNDIHNQNFSHYAKEMAEGFSDAPNWSDPGRTPTRQGAGASLFGFANSNYGSAGGWAQYTGTQTNKLKIYKQTEAAKLLNPALSSVAAEGDVAKAELALITNKLRSSPEAFVFHPTEENVLIPRKDFSKVMNGKGDPSETIQIKSESVGDFLKTHSDLNNERQAHVKNLKGAAGIGDDADPAVVYPPPINTTNYKNFAFVEPKGINIADKKRIIVAKDESTLTKLIDQVDKDQFKVMTKQDTEEWHKAVGDYNFSLGLNESVVDSSLKRKGVLSEMFPTTTGNKILDEYMDWHMNQESLLATRMVEHKYSQSFQELEHLGEQYTNVATSQFRSLTERLREGVRDPYLEIVKTALDISTGTEARYQWWRSFNDTIRNAIEQPINKLRDVFAKTPEITDEFVDKVNSISADLGMGKPYESAYQALIASKNVASKPWLARGIQKAQALMSTTLLQWDFFNAINNAVGTPIITSAEVNNLVRNIQRANPQAAGKLAELMQVSSPADGSVVLPTTGRLIKQALENYRADATSGGTLLKRYQDIGAVTDILQQERQMLDKLTWKFTETPGQVDSALKQATDFGKKWTGNKLAEEMSRFVAADVMRQITDIAQEAGVLAGEKEANEYIQLFVNRTQGNYLHSQRPIVFQGVVGQAVSLFQTYQFNLMQQLFRYVGEGDAKSVAILLGLQGSIYGMQGLPAFNFLNTHIVGNASGNTEHRDLYFATNSVFGKSLGDWMMYGIGSNALGLIDPSMKVNLYSRGDINPRQMTVLPTSLSDVPIISASVRFAQTMWKASERIAAGGSFWPVMSQAIEHNGLSRPLAGLAQIAQGYTTTSEASLLTASQDFWRVATLSRIAGGKPFDEAVALDALYRINAYRAKDLSDIQQLGSAIKTTVVGGGQPTGEQIVDFAKEYAKRGGRIESFNTYMANIMINARKSQVNKIITDVKSPFSQQMQVIMGGQPLPDFINTPANPQSSQ